MKKNIAVLFLLFILTALMYGDEFYDRIDRLNFDGKYEDALHDLEKKYAENKSDLVLAWFIARECIFISELKADKKEKLDLYEKGITYTKPYLDKEYDAPEQKSSLIYWYTINYASKIRDKGIFAGREGMNIIPEVFKLIDKCLEIYPQSSDAYFFRGKFYGEIPGFLGGSKIRMEEDFASSIKYAGEDERIFLYSEISLSLFKRNWNIANKLKEAKKAGIPEENLLSTDKSDKDLAIYMLNDIIKKLNAKKDMSFREKNILADALKSIKENT